MDADTRLQILTPFLGEFAPKYVAEINEQGGEHLLVDLEGFDSLRFLEWQIMIEEMAGEDLPDELLASVRTLEDIIEIIEAARNRWPRD